MRVRECEREVEHVRAEPGTVSGLCFLLVRGNDLVYTTKINLLFSYVVNIGYLVCCLTEMGK